MSNLLFLLLFGLFQYIALSCSLNKHPLLFDAGDISRGGMSVTQGQKFHTDDIKSVWNLVRSADWSTK